MIIYPAIDLIGGAAVRLLRGDYSKKTEYSSDPVSVALSFRERGARFLHLVDLDRGYNPLLRHGSRNRRRDPRRAHY